MFIESKRFVNSNDVQVSGYIWQVYDDDIHAGISRGFDGNIVLTPHFKSYTGPSKQREVFGVNKDIVLGTWSLEKTFYDYHLSDYDTNFGLPNYIGQQGFPELQFNLVLKREFIDALVINLVPLMVVAILLFSVVMLTTANSKKAEVFGFNTAMVFGTCSALFFVVMLSHIRLREQFSGIGVVYMEHFYLMMYFIILVVAVDAYRFTGKWVSRQTNSSAINQDNLYSKLLYWPFLLGVSITITYVVLIV